MKKYHAKSPRHKFRQQVKLSSFGRSLRFVFVSSMAVGLWGCGQSSEPTSNYGDDTKQSDSVSPAKTKSPKLSKSRNENPNRSAQLAGPASSDAVQQTTVAETKPAKALPVYRPSDSRRQHDDEQLAELGIHVYESKRLKLYTDIDAKIARTLPPVMDQAYEAWESYFGKLPPNREGTEYQLTGYIMAEKALFRETNLLPEDLPGFLHGRHRGAEFWMNDQKWDYYRRHLMIHEGTHCFMTTMPGVSCPVWYLEGMAELFGTHRIDADGNIRFRVMPHNQSDYSGFGRIELVHQDIDKTRYKTLGEIVSQRPNDYLEPYAYAWAWALCEYFDSHPRYHERFRELGQHTQGSEFYRQFRKTFQGDRPKIWTEWPLFASNLEYGYDSKRAAIDFETGKPLAENGVADSIEIATDRGWQSTGVLIEEGRTYEVTATGRFTLAQEPKPWISGANGISFRYYRGKPIGLLIASIRSAPPAGDTGVEPMLQEVVIGPKKSFVAPITGTLYLRINEYWSELADNTGRLTVKIRADKNKRPNFPE